MYPPWGTNFPGVADAVEVRAGRNTAARVATVIAVAGAVALAGALLFLRGGDTYTVKARFLNVGQLVDGSPVEVGGIPAGEVKGFDLTDDGVVEVEIAVEDRHAPLYRGTKAVIRHGSVSSVANKYVELLMPPENQRGEKIDDGGVIGQEDTTTAVEVDAFLATFDQRTRRSLKAFYRGNYLQYYGRGRQANRGWKYLSPQLSASTRLFRELSYDPPVLERWLVDTSRFVTALAERRRDLAPLIENLNRTTRALGNQREALAELLERFPDFLRTANTTFVNLRATLDDVEPFVEASKPVARKSLVFLPELRRFARDARPTIARLSRITRKPGRDNDLTELNRIYPALADIAVDTKRRKINFTGGDRDLGSRRGAFPEMTQALRDSAPIVAHGRPYTVDLLGWFDDFSHTGAVDAIGSFSRTGSLINAFTAATGPPLPVPLEPAQRPADYRNTIRMNQFKRCPGAAEEAAPDGSNVWSEEEQRELDCVEGHRATGNYTPRPGGGG
jgi:phospholipid/cholesterol/gamma-HCH transport system substrate-binding protein